jgi:hypothetical protein
MTNHKNRPSLWEPLHTDTEIAMNISREARKIDTKFYVDFDTDCGYWCVFGNNSGFAYSSWHDYAQAKDALNEMESK